MVKYKTRHTSTLPTLIKLDEGQSSPFDDNAHDDDDDDWVSSGTQEKKREKGF